MNVYLIAAKNPLSVLDVHETRLPSRDSITHEWMNNYHQTWYLWFPPFAHILRNVGWTVIVTIYELKTHHHPRVNTWLWRTVGVCFRSPLMITITSDECALINTQTRDCFHLFLDFNLLWTVRGELRCFYVTQNSYFLELNCDVDFSRR